MMYQDKGADVKVPYQSGFSKKPLLSASIILSYITLQATLPLVQIAYFRQR